MEKLYKVVYTGELTPGADRERVIASLSKRFGMDAKRARVLLDAGKDLPLKRGLEKSKAEQYLQILEQIGLIVRLEAMPSKSTRSEFTLAPVDSRNSVDTASVQQADDSRSNPYAAPQSELERETNESGMTAPTRQPTGHGWHWVTRGFWHFRQNPITWVAATVAWVLLAVITSLIPFVGSLAVTIFSPVVMAGFLIGAESQDQGKDFKIGHLFAGFSNQFGQLVLAGVLYLVGLIACLFAVGLVMGGVFAMLGGMGGMEEPDPEVIAAIMSSPSMIASLLVGLALITPLIMAFWFAPALIALEGVSAVHAMKQSFIGCLKNALPFLLYGIVALVLLTLGALPVGLGLLIAIPVLVASIYASFKDIYYE